MTRGTPISDEVKAEVLRLHALDTSRNEIARITGIGASTVTRIVKEAGGEFDRAMTKRATEARAVDMAALRLRLAEKMADRSEKMLDRLDDPYLVYNFGGKDNDYNEHTLDRPPVEVERNAVVTAGIAFDKLTRIVEKSDTGLEQAVGVLDTIAEGFAAAAARYRMETPDED